MTSSLAAPLDWDRSVRQAALKDLRSARRHNRVAQLDRFDAFYKAYVSAIAGIIAVYAAAGWFGDAPIRYEQVDDVIRLAPVYLGLGVAFLLAIGLRSGGRGGPLAFEKADVRHILLAPVAREDAVRSAAWRGMRHSAFSGLTTGAIFGIIATRRFEGNAVEWVLGGALFVGSMAIGAYGLALLCSGLRTPRWATDVLAFAFAVWAVADAVLQTITSPFTWLAHIAIWPLEFSWFGAVGVGVMIALAVAGLWAIPGWSIEAAERRSRLVGQLRFAATMQDVRTVMVIQRQLAQEHLRVKPLIRLRPLRKAYNRKGEPRLSVFARRSLHTILRWSPFRLLRLVALGLVSGFAVLGAWGGTAPLFAVAGLVLWISAMDLLEPLAQESDHPDRMAGGTRLVGWVWWRLMFVPFIAQLLLVVIACIPVFVFGGDEAVDVSGITVPTVVLVAMASLGGAALAVTRAPSTGASTPNITPEITGVITLWRLAGPPAIAVLGFLPLGIAHRDWEIHHDVARMYATMTQSWYIAFAVGLSACLWIRGGIELKERMFAATAQAAEEAKTNREGSKK